MKKVILTISMVVVVFTAIAQQKEVTFRGKQVDSLFTAIKFSQENILSSTAPVNQAVVVVPIYEKLLSFIDSQVKQQMADTTKKVVAPAKPK